MYAYLTPDAYIPRKPAVIDPPFGVFSFSVAPPIRRQCPFTCWGDSPAFQTFPQACASIWITSHSFAHHGQEITLFEVDPILRCSLLGNARMRCRYFISVTVHQNGLLEAFLSVGISFARFQTPSHARLAAAVLLRFHLFPNYTPNVGVFLGIVGYSFRSPHVTPRSVLVKSTPRPMLGERPYIFS